MALSLELTSTLEKFFDMSLYTHAACCTSHVQTLQISSCTAKFQE